MSIKLQKDKSGLVAEGQMLCIATKPHYFDVYLWGTRADMVANTVDMCMETVACCPTVPYLIDVESGEPLPKPKIGEVHFVKGDWNLEAVAHELCHALIHRLRVLCPSPRSVMEQEEEYEEDICYEFGAWVDSVYKFLWEHDPGKNWIRREDAVL